MAEIIITVEENTSPSIPLTVQRDGVDIDLTTASTVELVIIDDLTRTVTNTGHQSCTITSAAGGEVSYAPAAGDFADEGRYLGQIKITWSGGAVERIPELLVIITERKH